MYDTQPQEHLLSLSAFLEGVTIGITIAVIVGGYNWIEKYYKRRKEIQHMKSFLSEGHRKIENASNINHGGQTASKDIVRFICFESILRDLDSILLYRCHNMHYTETYDIRKVLRDVSSMIEALCIGRKNPPIGMGFYNQMFFDKFNDLQWLKLCI